MDEKRIELLGQIKDIIGKCGGYDKLNQPITMNLFYNGMNHDITFHAVVDVVKNVSTDNDGIKHTSTELYAIDSKYEIWDIDDFCTNEQLEILLDGLMTKRVSVKLNVEVTFDVDADGMDMHNVERLAKQMVSDKLDYDLNTCYGHETFVGYDVSEANPKQNYIDEMAM